MKVWLTWKGGRLSLPPHLNQGYTSSQFFSITMRPAVDSTFDDIKGRVLQLSCRHPSRVMSRHQVFRQNSRPSYHDVIADLISGRGDIALGLNTTMKLEAQQCLAEQRVCNS